MNNPIAIAILVGLGLIALAIYLKPTEYEACVEAVSKYYKAGNYPDSYAAVTRCTPAHTA